MDREQAMEMAQVVLEASEADQTEVILSASQSALTRFANNAIHQNVAETVVQASVRAVVGKRVGVVTGSDLSPEGLRQLARDARDLARVSAPDEDFVSLPGPVPYSGETDFADPATADFTPEGRAEGVRLAILAAESQGLTAAGAFSTGWSSTTVANSLGVATYQCRTQAELSVVVAGSDSSGYARTAAAQVSDIDAAALGETATQKCLTSRHPQEVEPGDYTVILEPEAVGDMIMMLSMYDLGALAVQEGRSFMAGQMGQRVCGTNISIWDDGHDPRGLRMAYDFEGVPKQRVNLITDGVAAGVVWDSYTAQREGRSSTGHALPAPNHWGPVPINVFVATGDSSLGEMIANTEYGLLVTRFHYTNMIHPIRTVFTGMTRDGTFLIRDGRIAAGLKNLRFTQSILEALSGVSAIAREGQLTDYVWCPAMKLDAFSFSSATEF
ncbi:MAG: TldD/PmbA family protein [Armatimonadetes bacterium]|nr:TldD/PmbA family protein [Armatimonadota bacterium]